MLSQIQDHTMLSETELLLLAQAGDMDAFGALQLRLERQIHSFVRRLVGDMDCDDVVQDVFIVLYKHLATISPPEKLRPFLFRVARNRCYDLLRRGGRYDAVTLDDEPMLEWVSLSDFNPIEQPEDLTHWVLLYMEVQEAIDRLPEVQRQALILYAEEGMSYPEIAEVMDSSIGTVKSRIHYAKKALRQMLRPEILDEVLS